MQAVLLYLLHRDGTSPEHKIKGEEMKVFEMKKGWEGCRDGKVMMAIEGLEEICEKIDSLLQAEGYKAAAQEEGDKEGTICVIYVVDRSDVVSFKEDFKIAKKAAK